MVQFSKGLHHFRSMFYFDLYNFRETMKVRNFIPKNRAERFQDSDVTQGCRTSALIVLVMLIRMGSNTYIIFIHISELSPT